MVGYTERPTFTMGFFTQLREDETHPNIFVGHGQGIPLMQAVTEDYQFLPVRLPVAGWERVLNRRA